MAPESPESESATAALSLPEKIEPADLEALNQAIGALMVLLRHARDLSLGEPHGRQGAVVALHAVWGFLTRFEPVLAGEPARAVLSLQQRPAGTAGRERRQSRSSNPTAGRAARHPAPGTAH